MASKKRKRDITTSRLNRNYIIALSLVAMLTSVGQIYIQSAMQLQQKDSRVVNIAGRQRMYSQKLSKLALLLLSKENKESIIGDLEVTLKSWSTHHYGLLRGDKELDLPGKNSSTILSMFDMIEFPFEQIQQNAELLLIEKDEEKIAIAVDNILKNEAFFLNGMDQIVFQYDSEAYQKVKILKRIELILFILTIGVLIIEALFIFKPSVLNVQKAMSSLKEAEVTSRRIADKLKTTNKALKNSLRELTNLNLALEEATMMIKLNPSGMIEYANQNFYEVLDYKEKELVGRRFYTLCDKYLSPSVFNDMWNTVDEGRIWKKEIVIHDKHQNQFWMDLVSIPIINDTKQIFECICVFNNISSKFEEKINEQRIKSVSVIEGQEEERQRIARELHDGLGQMMSAMKFNLESLKLVDDEKQGKKLEGIKKLMSDTITEVRKISFNLMPSVLSDYGLVSALKILTEELSKHTGIEMSFELNSTYQRVDKSVEITIYRTVQEAINNAVKYSESEKVEVVMYCDEKSIHIQVIDTGKGFDPTAPKKSSSSYGRGIINMKERTELVKGNFSIDSSPGKGTNIHIEFPIG